MPRASRRPRPARGAAWSSSGSRSWFQRSGHGATVEDPDLNPGGEPPEDDRNELVDDSPVPDPEENGGSADDVPQAD
jgi:hypothetical protein